MRTEITPPEPLTHRLGDIPEAADLRTRQAVIKLKKLRLQYGDAEDLALVWAVVDQLAD